jgi:TatD DNase family protein
MNKKVSEYKYIDCHSHPHDEKYEKEDIDINLVLENLEADSGATIAIGTYYDNSAKAINLSLIHKNVWATIGIHPVDRNDIHFDESKFDELYENSKTESGYRVVGIGECGLDYFYFDKLFIHLDEGEKQDRIKIEKDRQRDLFIKQIKYALNKNLPLILHGRPSKGSQDAYVDILDILEDYKKENNKLKGHAHFFVGDLSVARRFLNLGFLLSFDGPITFTSEYDEVIRYIPLESMMIETDSPYAAPTPYRGQINYPIYVIEVAKKIALLKNIDLEQVLEITKQNTIKLFNLK